MAGSIVHIYLDETSLKWQNFCVVADNEIHPD